MSVLGNIDNLAEDNIRILKLPVSKLAKPLAIILLGLPGSGKSTLVDFLSKNLPLAVLSDESMAHFLLPYKATFFQHSQKEALELASKTMEKLIQRGISCIYDSSIKNRADREAIRKLIIAAGGVVLLIHINLSKEEAFKRVERGNLDVTRGEKKNFIMNRDLFEYEVASTQMPSLEEATLDYESRERENLTTLLEVIRSRFH